MLEDVGAMLMDFIIDIGAFETIIGSVSDSKYKKFVPTIFTDSNDPIIISSSLSKMQKKKYFGNDALKFKNVLNTQHFLKEKDYISFSFFLKGIFSDFGINVAKINLILLIPSMISSIEKHNLQEALFKILKVKKISFLYHSVCVLTALNQNSGVIIDFGHFSTRIESIYKGFPNEECKFAFPIGGNQLTQFLIDQIFSKYEYGSVSPLKYLVEEFKRRKLKCEINLKEILSEISQGSKEYNKIIKTPDEKEILIDKIRFLTPELFFDPSLAHIFSENIIDYIEKSIRGWGREQVRELCGNIIICGNGSNIPGLQEKICFKLKNRFPESIKIKSQTVDNPKSIFWDGALKIYKNKNGKMNWISKSKEE